MAIGARTYRVPVVRIERTHPVQPALDAGRFGVCRSGCFSDGAGFHTSQSIGLRRVVRSLETPVECTE